MTIALAILLVFLGYLIGTFTFPFLLFLRARRDGSWDNSNMTNIFRLIAHIAVHPSDFTKMRYIGDGKNPFWYITKDELSEVVDSRPPVEQPLDYEKQKD